MPRGRKKAIPATDEITADTETALDENPELTKKKRRPNRTKAEKLLEANRKIAKYEALRDSFQNHLDNAEKLVETHKSRLAKGEEAVKRAAEVVETHKKNLDKSERLVIERRAGVEKYEKLIAAATERRDKLTAEVKVKKKTAKKTAAKKSAVKNSDETAPAKGKRGRKKKEPSIADIVALLKESNARIEDVVSAYKDAGAPETPPAEIIPAETDTDE